jgi:uncharacterized protein (TIGR02246 family)
MMAGSSSGIWAAIEAANEVFMNTFGEGDAAGLAALYTEDGHVLPPNADFVKGQAAIEGFWNAIFGMGIRGATLEIVEVEDHGDTAIEMSRFTLMDGDGNALDQGKYVVVWKKVDGQWKLHWDVFNSSLPAPQ